MTYTAFEVNHETRCWMVRRYTSDRVEAKLGLVDGRKMTNDDYQEAEIWGPENAEQAIAAVKKREGWA